jgi:hypothetical protein
MVPIKEESGWATELVWIVTKNRKSLASTGVRTLTGQPVSQSLSGPQLVMWKCQNLVYKTTQKVNSPTAFNDQAQSFASASGKLHKNTDLMITMLNSAA